mmetsp:Transcript_8112/g.12038  ORF Transcript_8112/g.12038 Transcript_8112/m.12038 type:complete len:123 (-) Transcript_8112:1715-2083(-)
MFSFRYRRLEKEFEPKQSKNVSDSSEGGDGDTWIEAITQVRENGNQFRSYFYSKKTQERVWDEPPSGASNVVFADDIMHSMLEEMKTSQRRSRLGSTSGDCSNSDTLSNNSQISSITFHTKY